MLAGPRCRHYYALAMELLTLIPLMGLMAWLKRRLDAPPDFLPLVVVSAVLSVLYILSLAGLLRAGAIAVYGLGTFCFIIEGYRGRSNIRATLSGLLSPGLAMYLLAAVIFRIFFDGVGYYHWDTFAHWGLATKELFEVGALDRGNSSLILKDYPPGVAIFHYFVLIFSSYSEDKVCFANFLLLFAPACAVFRFIDRRNIPGLLLVSGLLYLLIFTFGQSVRAIPPDHTVGLMFGATVLLLVHDQLGHLRKAILGLPCLFALPLIKGVGLFLALLAAVIAVCDMMLQQRTAMGATKMHPTKILLIAAAMLLLPLAGSHSWSTYLHTAAVKSTFSAPKQMDVYRVLFTDRRSAREDLILNNFVEALTGNTLGNARLGGIINGVAWTLGGKWTGYHIDRSPDAARPEPLIVERPFSLAALAVVLGVLVILIAAAAPDAQTRRRRLVLAAWLVAGAVVYAAGLLLLYLFGLGDYEGVRLASYSRYMGTYSLGLCVIVLGLILYRPTDSGTKAPTFITLFGVLLGLILIAPRETVATILRHFPEPYHARAVIREGVAWVERQAPAGKRIYVVWQGSVGFEHRIMRYELAPRRINESCWSLGLKKDEGDVWTCPTRAAEWAHRLRQYDYVLIGRADEAFWNEFGGLFASSPQGPPARSGVLFEVLSRPGGSVSLRRL